MVSPLPPECEQLLVVGYVLGNLSPAEAMLFEELVADKPGLMEQVTEFQQALEVTYTTPEVAPPPELKDKVLKACLQEDTVQQEVIEQETEQKVNPLVIAENEAPVNTREKRSFWSLFLAAIAFILIAVLGYSNYRFWRTLQARNSGNLELADVTERNYRLTGQDVPETQAMLLVYPSQLRATLTANNLPPLPPEQVYALWTVVDENAPFTTDQKSAILTTVFEPDESGNLVKDIVVPQPHFTGEEIVKIAITVEDRSNPQAHTGSIFIATEDLN